MLLEHLLIKQNGNDTQANIEFNWIGIGGNAVNFNPWAKEHLILERLVLLP